MEKQKEVVVEEAILVFAFRYALGRRTYAPSMILEAVKCNVGDLSENSISTMIKEIKEEESAGRLGMNCDKETWKDLREFLELKLVEISKEMKQKDQINIWEHVGNLKEEKEKQDKRDKRKTLKIKITKDEIQ